MLLRRRGGRKEGEEERKRKKGEISESVDLDEKAERSTERPQ
jgi:hypothetical protein